MSTKKDTFSKGKNKFKTKSNAIRLSLLSEEDLIFELEEMKSTKESTTVLSLLAFLKIIKDRKSIMNEETFMKIILTLENNYVKSLKQSIKSKIYWYIISIFINNLSQSSTNKLIETLKSQVMSIGSTDNNNGNLYFLPNSYSFFSDFILYLLSIKQYFSTNYISKILSENHYLMSKLNHIKSIKHIDKYTSSSIFSLVNNKFLSDYINQKLLPFYEDKIMDDENITQSIAMHNLFEPGLSLLEQSSLELNDNKAIQSLFSNTKRLFERNSGNYKYIEVFFSYKRQLSISNSIYSEVFTKYEDYFFQTKNKTILFSAIKAFNSFMNNTFDMKIINSYCNFLLNTSFSADQSEINFSISLYLISLLTNHPVSTEILYKSIAFITSTLINNYKESSRAAYDEMMNLLIKAYKKYIGRRENKTKTKENENEDGNIIGDVLENINKILNESSLISFYPKILQVLSYIIIFNKKKSLILSSQTNFKPTLQRLTEYVNDEQSSSFIPLGIWSIIYENESDNKKDFFIKSIEKVLMNVSHVNYLYAEEGEVISQSKIRLSNISDDEGFYIVLLYLNLRVKDLYEELPEEYQDVYEKFVINILLSINYENSLYKQILLEKVFCISTNNRKILVNIINRLFKEVLSKQDKQLQIENQTIVKGSLKLFTTIYVNSLKIIGENIDLVKPEEVYKLYTISQFCKNTPILKSTLFKDIFTNETIRSLSIGFAYSERGVFSKDTLQFEIIKRTIYKQLNQVSTKSNQSQNILDLFNEEKIKSISTSIDFISKQITYLSYFDIKSLMIYMIDNEGLQPSFQFESSDKKKKSDKEKEFESSQMKNDILLFINSRLLVYRHRLLALNKLIQQGIFSFSDEILLNEKIFNKFLNISKISNVLFDPASDVVVDLLRNDYKIKKLGREYINFIIEAFKLTLLPENHENTENEENYEEDEEENKQRRLKSEKLNLFLDTCNKIKLGLSSISNEKDEKEKKMYNDFMKSFSNVLIEALYIVLESSEIENENKESAVDLLNIIISFDIDVYTLTKLTQFLDSFLRVSYYSSNLNKLLLTFYNKCQGLNQNTLFYSILDNILYYNYIVKSYLISILLQHNTIQKELQSYKSILSKIFILLFDSNSSLIDDVMILWNKACFQLSSDFISDEIFDLKQFGHQNRIIIEMTTNAIVVFLHLDKEFIKPCLEKVLFFIERNNKEAADLESEEDEENNEIDLSLQLIREVKILYLNIITDSIHLLTREDKLVKIKFILENAIYEKHPEVIDLYNSIIKKIMMSINDLSLYLEMLQYSETCLLALINNSSQEVKVEASQINRIHNPLVLLNTISVILKSISKTTNNSSLDLKIYEQLKKILFSTNNKVINENILISCTESIANVMKCCSRYLTEIDESSRSVINQLFVNNDNHIHHGNYYLLASIIKVNGIKYFYDIKLKEFILEKKSKVSNEVKIQTLKLLSILSKTLHSLFEPVFVCLFDFICEMISSREEIIRDAAMELVKTQMKCLSGYGVKCILPSLVKDLHDKNWKSKIVNVEILGHFSFCAPKQLSQFLPTVIKELLIVFKDPHPKVLETAVKVLKDISSVITNPEIVDISEILINAFSNPYELSKQALTSLLNTKFQHAIDPPSLGLIIPIIDYNLRIYNDENKKMAAQLIGAICYLITNPEIIHPYLDIILPNLKNALFDPSPEVRNSIAKAIGSLTKSLGYKYKHEITDWISFYLENDCDLVQRSGSAQAYAEILLAFGEDNITKSLPFIIDKIQQENKIWKEGYLGIFVFLPSCMGERFEMYFDYVFPLIIDGFSDESEKVRNVSNKIFEICISIFARKNTKELVTPLINCLFDKNWRIRNSSIALIKTLIINLHKEFFKDNSEFFTTELREEILANTFILKADTYGNTATIANMIWRDYVDNIPKYLSRILISIYNKIILLLSSQNDDTLDIAEGIINILVTKFSDKFFMELLPIINNTINNNKNDEITLYSSFLILQIASKNGSEKLLSGFKDNIIRIVNENISSKHVVIRRLQASIIHELSSKFQSQNISKGFIHSLLKTGRLIMTNEESAFEDYSKEESIELILDLTSNLIEISQGEILNNVLHEIFKKPYIGKFFDILNQIDMIGSYLKEPTHIREIFNNIFLALTHVPEESIQSIVSIACQIDVELLNIFYEVLEKNRLLIKKPSEEGDFILYMIRIINEYLLQTDQDLNENSRLISNYINNFLQYDIDNESNRKTNSIMLIPVETYNQVMTIVNKAFKAFILKIEKDKNSLELVISYFNEQINNIISQYIIEDDAFRLSLKEERLSTKLSFLIESILQMIDSGLVYIDDKSLICKVIDVIISNISKSNIKTYLIKLSGKIIKVLSEKSNNESKDIVLGSLNTLINKLQSESKVIIPHFRTILSKNLNEFSVGEGNEKLMLKTSECILNLLKYDNRPDMIINDINKTVMSKINMDMIGYTFLDVEILCYVFKFNMKNVKESIIKENISIYTKIYKENLNNQGFPYDIYLLLLAVLNEADEGISKNKQEKSNEILSIITEESNKNQNNHADYYSILVLFLSNEDEFNLKSIVKRLKSIGKENCIVCLKLIGKIINKSSFIIEKSSKIMSLYNDFLEEIIENTNFFVPSVDILDANMLIFILSIGYSPVYDKNMKVYHKVIDYLLLLIKVGKINSQLMINALCLLILKQVLLKPDLDLIVSDMFSLGYEEDKIQIVKDFFLKAYYLFK